MPAKRVLISIDERILSRIDDAARRTGLTRSRFLAEAALAQIDGTTDGPGAKGGGGSNPIRGDSDDT